MAARMVARVLATASSRLPASMTMDAVIQPSAREAVRSASSTAGSASSISASASAIASKRSSFTAPLAVTFVSAYHFTALPSACHSSTYPGEHVPQIHHVPRVRRGQVNSLPALAWVRAPQLPVLLSLGHLPALAPCLAEDGR